MSYVCFETQLFGLVDSHPSDVVARAKEAIAKEFDSEQPDLDVHLVECSGNWKGLNFENA